MERYKMQKPNEGSMEGISWSGWTQCAFFKIQSGKWRRQHIGSTENDCECDGRLDYGCSEQCFFKVLGRDKK